MKKLRDSFNDGCTNADDYAISSILIPAFNGLIWAGLAAGTATIIGSDYAFTIGLAAGSAAAGGIKLALAMAGNDKTSLSIIRPSITFAAVSAAGAGVGLDPLANIAISGAVVGMLFPRNISKFAGIGQGLFNKVIDKIIPTPVF